MDDAKAISVERWLTKARNDLVTAQTMIATDPPVTDTASFHSQQCVEKALKAFLVHSDVQIERTHYLPKLVEACAAIDARFRALRDSADELTNYAVANRYPDDWREIPIDEARSAAKRAAEAMDFVCRILGVRRT